MDYNELAQNLKEQLQYYGPKVPYGELVGAEPPYNRAGDLVWPDPEPYYIEQAINAITELLARVEAAEARAEKAEKQLDSLLEEEETAPFGPFRMEKED